MSFNQESPCSIVLVRTKFAGNLGAVARAMANFGVTDLRLVTPEADPQALEARAMASHGEAVLERSRRFATLVDAVADCGWVACTSSRLGGLFRHQNVVSLREGVEQGRAASRRGRVALVFGPENDGLTNDEVSLCHQLIHISAHPDYYVLNLAQAVAISLYEWYQLAGAAASPEQAAAPASAGELDRMFEHLEDGLRAIHFVWGEKGPSVFHALRHLISRAQPTEVENKLLHGLARQMLWYAKRHPAGDGKKMEEEEA
ncbi:MAG TPA: RNA methyltransferase [Gemmatales bacterium]|nr:RNA methyltransferase [Gemmatales bacterium]